VFDTPNKYAGAMAVAWTTMLFCSGLPLLLRTLNRLAVQDNDPKLAARVQKREDDGAQGSLL
jgi:hypothetical protein